MMYVKGQREAVVFGYALAIAALLCVVGYVSSGGCGHTSTDADTAGGNGKSTTQQVERATELNQQAGAAVKSAAGAVERAEQRAESAAAANQSAQARAADCKKLVDKLQSDNQRAKQIIDELIRGAQTGAAQDAAH